MARGELVLGAQEQLDLAKVLVANDLFGIRQNEADYITLKSKRLSPHYLDIRKGLSNFSVRQVIAGSMARLAVEHTGKEQLGVDYVVGSPEAMTSYAATIADRQQMGLLQPRVALDKASGNKAPILGRYEPGERVAAFDDVMTDGDTKISTVESLRGAGLEVIDYYVVLDREEGGAAQVAEATGIEVTPALGVSSLVRLLHAEGVCNDTQYGNVARYLEQYGDQHAKETINTAM